MNNLKKGILLAFLASVISGFAIFYSKISVAKISPLVLTTSRNFYVGVLFLVLFLVSGRIKELKKLKKEQLTFLILIGFIGGALPFYLFFTGLQYIPAINANLIQKTLFVWVTILAVIFLKEKITAGYFVSFALIFTANFFFAKFNLTFGKGELMILGGTILFLYVYTWYKALKYTPASLAALILTFAVVVGNILNGAFAGIKILPKDIYSSLFISTAAFIILIKTNVIPNLFRDLLSKNQMLK